MIEGCTLICHRLPCCSRADKEYIECPKVPGFPISLYDKDSPDLWMSVYVVFPTMLNDIFESFSPIEEDGLQVFQDHFIPYLVQSREYIEIPDPWFLAWTLQRAKSRIDPDLANKVGEERSQASNCQVYRSPCDHGIVNVHKNALRQNLWKNRPLISTISGSMLWIKYSWLNGAPYGNAFNVMRLTLLKKIVNITFCAFIVAFSLRITLSQLPANISSERHQ
jgi:hypothetical protein